jgi:hypothetical protein
LYDTDEGILAAIEGVEGIDAKFVVDALDAPATTEAYEEEKRQARLAAGTPTEFQGKSATTAEGVVRYTAPSIRFSNGETTLEAGGFQTIEAYDVVVANLDTSLVRHAAPEGAAQALDYFGEGLVTQEVAALLARPLEAPSRERAEDELLKLVAEGSARRVPLGDDALWVKA